MRLSLRVFSLPVVSLELTGDDEPDLILEAESLPFAFTGCTAELVDSSDDEEPADVVATNP